MPPVFWVHDWQQHWQCVGLQSWQWPTQADISPFVCMDTGSGREGSVSSHDKLFRTGSKWTQSRDWRTGALAPVRPERSRASDFLLMFKYLTKQQIDTLHLRKYLRYGEDILLVHKEYTVAYRKLQSYKENHLPGVKRTGGVVVTGQPGIGMHMVFFANDVIAT